MHRATKKIGILTLVLSEKKFLNVKKDHNSPLQVKWSVPKSMTKKILKNMKEFQNVDNISYEQDLEKS